LAPNSKNGQWHTVRCFLTWLVGEDALRRNPMQDMEPPKVPRTIKRVLNDEQIQQVIDACPDQRARVIVILALQLGLRRAQIAKVESGDIDFVSKVVEVRVRRSGGGEKGDNERVLPLTAEAEREILAYLDEIPGHAGPLIRSQKDPRVGVLPPTVGRTVMKALYAAGVKVRPRDGYGTHAFRRTAATHVYYRSGHNVRAVQQMLGHSNLNTTERYIALADVESLREVIEGRTYLNN